MRIHDQSKLGEYVITLSEKRTCPLLGRKFRKLVDRAEKNGRWYIIARISERISKKWEFVDANALVKHFQAKPKFLHPKNGKELSKAVFFCMKEDREEFRKVGEVTSANINTALRQMIFATSFETTQEVLEARKSMIACARRANNNDEARFWISTVEEDFPQEKSL